MIRIETPDALAGFLLVQKLRPFGAEVRGSGADGRWEVCLPAAQAERRLHEVLAAVVRWLEEERLPSTTVHAPSGSRVVAAQRERTQ